MLLLVKKKKKTEDHEPTNSATIFFSSLANTTYNNGDTVWVLADVSTIEDMHGYEVTIRNTTSNTVVFNKNGTPHGKFLNIYEKWICNVTSLSNMEVEVMVVLDHDKNTAVKKVTFQCNP